MGGFCYYGFWVLPGFSGFLGIFGALGLCWVTEGFGEFSCHFGVLSGSLVVLFGILGFRGFGACLALVIFGVFGFTFCC